MKVLEGGNVSMDAADLELMKSKYFVSMHAPSYANIIGLYMADGSEMGFCCWIDNLEFYVGDERVRIENDAHLAACFAMMDAILVFGNMRPE